MPRICQREVCDKPLPPTAATQRKYCSERCQVAEWRRKKREQERRADLEQTAPPDASAYHR